MLTFGADVRFSGLDQILQPSIWGGGQSSALSRPHCHPELRCLARHFGPFGDALVTGLGLDHLLTALQQLCSWGEIVHVGGRGDDGVDQPGILGDADMDFHSVVSLVALLGLVPLKIPLPLAVLGGAGRCNQGGIHDRALAHRHAPCAQVSIDGRKDLLAQAMLLQQVAKGENRGLIRDPITDQIDCRKPAHDGHLNQGLFHRRITECVPLLQQVNPQQPLRGSQGLRGQGIRRPPTLLAGFGVVGLNQRDQYLPGHHRLHLRQELFPLGLLLGSRLLVVREAELLAAHQHSPDRPSRGHCPAGGLGFPEFPWLVQITVHQHCSGRPRGSCDTRVRLCH